MAGLVRGVAAGIVALAVALCGCRAEERMQATLDKPAVVTALPGGANLTDNPAAPRLVLTIVAFTPPPDKAPVEIVVRAAPASGGAARELGRVAITPYAAFGRRDAGRAQTFAFALPAELKSEGQLSVEVALVPVRGGGKGASLEVGGASIH